MARRLRGHVHVRNETGVPFVFGPDDDVPSWAEDKISNPAAWSDGSALPTEPSDPAPARTEVRSTPEAGSPPPQRGPGSSTSAWRDYAERVGVRVGDDADRSDIIAAVQAKGAPIE